MMISSLRFIVKLHSSMGVKVDFAKAVISSGVDTQVSLNLPGCLSIGYDYDSSRLVLGWKPVSSVGPTSLFHYNVRPFTCLRASDRCNAINDEKEITTDGVTPQKVACHRQPHDKPALIVLFSSSLVTQSEEKPDSTLSMKVKAKRR